MLMEINAKVAAALPMRMSTLESACHISDGSIVERQVGHLHGAQFRIGPVVPFQTSCGIGDSHDISLAEWISVDLIWDARAADRDLFLDGPAQIWQVLIQVTEDSSSSLQVGAILPTLIHGSSLRVRKGEIIPVP